MKKYIGILIVSAGLFACSHGGAGTLARPLDSGARMNSAGFAPSAGPSAPSMDEDAALFAQKAPGKPATPATAPAVTPPKEESMSDATPLTRRLIVYAAALSVGVFEPEKSAQASIELAEKVGGYLKSRSNNDLVVRIPADQFFAFIKELESFGLMASRVINSEDITSQFVDLTIRLNNLMITRTRLQAILEKARNVEETLAVERELTRVSGEIEQIKGRLRLFQNLVDFATVQLTFFLRHGQSSVTPNPVKVDTPIYWIKRFDVVTLFRD